ncbi:12S seed storage globulin 1 [Brachypodium distachyon]|uniref:Cupin type-1 domain-containing protein n=1 Tax=Brachypodium distachyon TaxID=15368 RepID=I1HNH9_BRADI|nr:12S seed storage globulin 1 [Brachypodium distachyon]KQK08275.1 hypothetical protein BRADI_2g40840v3 [Brachypodium distachyon]|eukprot:XP_010231907.1 12S seed storage globulin 1 [Brachypodium distachyon]
MAHTSFSSFLSYFCLFLLFHGSMAQVLGQVSTWQSSRQGGSRDCSFDRLQAIEPVTQVRSQAGLTEYFDEQNEQFRCAGVFVIRRVIEPRGLLLPRYHNTPGLVYILQGNGFVGLTFPGCPETFREQFQQFRQTQSTLGQSQCQSQKLGDVHQRVHQFTQGDVVALPTGVAHWIYNGGDAPVVIVYVFDVNNNANQLEPRQKEFLLGGNYNGVLQYGQNIFSGFNAQLLSQAFGINEQTSQRIQNQNDGRGDIIRVDNGLQFLKPVVTQQQPEQPFMPIQHQTGQSSRNGLEENFCSLEPRQNIEDPNRADTYNPRAGSITRLNGQNFPILNLVQMSATRVNLQKNAILSPFWNINAHSVVYVIQGHALVQVVNNQGHNVFNGLLHRGQLLIIPQNYVVLKKAESEGYQYIAFKTNANSMVSHIAGKNSILRALPVDVIANAYRISRQEAQNLKNNRGEETGVLTPNFSQSTCQSYQTEDVQSLRPMSHWSE